MSRETFLSLRNYLWLWFSLVITLFCFLIYFTDKPIGGRNGGTVVGYSLGVLSTLGILYLMWYGIRKRSYYSKMTTLKSVLSSHVWIGLSLVFIVPLHAGFSFGWNVHTFTYILMLLTIASGVWGVVLFRTYPFLLSSQRGGATESQLLTTIYGLNSEIKDFVSASKSLRSDAFLKMIQSIDLPLETTFLKVLFYKEIGKLDDQKIARLLEDIPPNEQEDAMSCLKILHKKRMAYFNLLRETKVQFVLKAWLYLHVPLSFSLCGALAIHICSVFYYW